MLLQKLYGERNIEMISKLKKQKIKFVNSEILNQNL